MQGVVLRSIHLEAHLGAKMARPRSHPRLNLTGTAEPARITFHEGGEATGLVKPPKLSVPQLGPEKQALGQTQLRGRMSGIQVQDAGKGTAGTGRCA